MEIDKGFLTRLLGEELTAMGFDEEAGAEVVEALGETVTEYMPKLRQAVTEADLTEIGFFAHALKGTFNNFSNPQFTELAELFKTVELEAKKPTDLKIIKTALTQIESNLRSFLD